MKKTGLLMTVCSLVAFNAFAAQTEITIYNQDLALIKKSQNFSLKGGINDIVFDEIAQQLKPESVFIYGDNIRVLEQNYDYAGINYATMLNAHIGKTVKTVRQNPDNGKNIFENAVLVAADGASPVLKFDYGIETNFPGRVLFDTIPPELNSTPVLMAKIETANAGNKNLNLAYLATGFSWQANYVVNINDDTTLSLLGRAALSNDSGSGYDDVKVNLVAGDVNTVRQYMQPRAMKAMGVNMMVEDMVEKSAAPVISAPVAMDSYYIYKIPEKTTLKNGQMKQVSFINAPKVKYEKEGVLNSSIYFGTTKTYYKDVHPSVYYRFTNQKEDGLGMPLPQGKISFYAPDDSGALQFIGENMIDNKAEGQKVSLQLGKFFDVYGEGKITEINKTDTRKYRKQKDDCPTVAETYHYKVLYTVVNKGKKDVKMVLKQPLNGTAAVVKESLEGQYGDGHIREWHFTLKAGATQEISVEVENIIEQRRCDEIVLE